MSSVNNQDSCFTGVQAIKEMFRQSSADELKRAIKADSIAIVNELRYKGPVFGHLLTFIMLVGPAFRVSLKIFYGINEARRFSKARFSNLETQLDDRIVFDFMKDFANLAAGAVKRSLGKIDLSVGIGLPLTTRGFDDVFAADGLADGVYTDSWSLKSDQGEIICMLSLKVLEDAKVAGIRWSPDQAVEETSEMEFL
jgi:hypothetical protein